jgi:predicted glycosyltransferase
MDSSISTVNDWQEKGIYDAMQEFYDEIWVYGCQDFYDPVSEYEIPPNVASKIRFTGYIPRKVPTAEDIAATRKEFSVMDDEKLILITIGGGGDGYPVIKTFLSAFDSSQGGVPKGIKVVVVTGPFISAKDYKEIRKETREFGFTTLKFHRYMEGLIGAANVVVSMGGYNTVCEIASQRKPFLIVPRTVPREEQLIRAQVLCSQGFCDYLDPREMAPERVREKILALLHNGTAYREKMARFPFTALDTIKQRILENNKMGCR